MISKCAITYYSSRYYYIVLCNGIVNIVYICKLIVNMNLMKQCSAIANGCINTDLKGQT